MCPAGKQQGRELTEALSQTQALLALRGGGRTAAEQQAGELAGLRKALERELAASREREENLRGELKAAESRRGRAEEEPNGARTGVGSGAGEGRRLGLGWVSWRASSDRKSDNAGTWEQQAAELKRQPRPWRWRDWWAGSRNRASSRVESGGSRRGRPGGEPDGARTGVGSRRQRSAISVSGGGELEQQPEQQAGNAGLEQLVGLRWSSAGAGRGERDQKKNLRAELECGGSRPNRARRRTERRWGRSWVRRRRSWRVEVTGGRVGEPASRGRSRGNLERRAAELEQARVALQGEIREWAEREGELSRVCPAGTAGPGVDRVLESTQWRRKCAAGAAEQQAALGRGCRKRLRAGVGEPRAGNGRFASGLEAAIRRDRAGDDNGAWGRS